jgi:Na+/melibiose symporter-like transporter
MYSVTFQPTPEDLIAAARLNYRTTLRSKRVILPLIGGCVVLGLIGWFVAEPAALGSAPVLAAIGVGYWAVIFSSILVVSYLRIPSRMRRNFAQQRALHDPTTIDWSDAGITITAERGHLKLAWTDFVRIVKGRDAIVLRQTDLLMNFVPTRVLSTEQIDSFPETR